MRPAGPVAGAFVAFHEGSQAGEKGPPRPRSRRSRVYSADVREPAEREPAVRPDPPGLAARPGPLACRRRLFRRRAGGISLEALVRHRMAIDALVNEQQVLAVLLYIALYIVTVALSLPGAALLTVAGGSPFGLMIGASAAVIARPSGRRSSSWSRAARWVSRCCGGPDRAPPSWRKAFATTPSAISCSCGWYRPSRFSWLTWCRLSPASVWDPSSRRPCSASSPVRPPLPLPVPVSMALLRAAGGQSRLPRGRPDRLSDDLRCQGRAHPAIDRRAGRARPACPRACGG